MITFRTAGTAPRSNRSLASAVLAATIAVTTLGTSAALAGPIQNACIESPRARGDRALCGCVQAAADATLTRGDQRRAARFFRDPHRAQEVRMSKSDSDNAFWARYRNFGDLAEARCAR